MAIAEPRGLGGWLVLVMLGLLGSAFQQILNLLTGLVPIFTEGTWAILTDPASPAYHPLWAPVIIFELVAAVVLFGAALYGLSLFGQKSPRFPTFMIGFYFGVLAFAVLDAIGAGVIQVALELPDSEGIRDVVRSALTCAVWVPYMKRSRRVRNTFVAQDGIQAEVVPSPVAASRP